jgi:hypothetical protein
MAVDKRENGTGHLIEVSGGYYVGVTMAVDIREHGIGHLIEFSGG